MRARTALTIVGALPLLWGLGNLSGPLLFLCRFGALADHVPPSVYGAAGHWLRAGQSLAGLGLALACVWVGLGTLRGLTGARRRLGALLRAMVAVNVALVIVPAIPEPFVHGVPALVLAYKGSQAGLTVLRGLGEVVAALSLLWYLRALDRAGDKGSITPGADARLAGGILLAREGAQLLAAPSSVPFLAVALQSSPIPVLHVLMLMLGPAAGLAALAAVVNGLALRRPRPAAALVALGVASVGRVGTLLQPWPDAHAGGVANVLLVGGTLGSGLAILAGYAVLAYLLGQGAEPAATEAPNEV